MGDLKPDYIAKIILVGDSSVGKSNLVTRWYNDEFSLESKATIGLELLVKNVTVHNKVCNAQIWDTAGQERFKSLTSSYYRGCHGAILVFDITSYNSFISVANWLEEVRKVAPQETAIILVANKVDLANLREVSTEEGQLFAQKNDLLYIETSALHSTNVEKAFVTLIEEIFNRLPKVENKEIEQMSHGLSVKIGNDEMKEKPQPTGICC
jgi:small GTP-binding protein